MCLAALIALLPASAQAGCDRGASRTGNEPVHVPLMPAGPYLYADGNSDAMTFYVGYTTSGGSFYEVGRYEDGSVAVHVRNVQADVYIGTDAQCAG